MDFGEISLANDKSIIATESLGESLFPVEIWDTIWNFVSPVTKIILRFTCECFRSKSRNKKGEKVAKKSCEEGDLKVLKFLRKNGYVFNFEDSIILVKNGNIPAVEWISEFHDIYSFFYTNAAVEGKQLEMLKWLKDQKIKFGDFIFEVAVESGNLEIINWLWDRCYRMGSDLINKAIGNGRLEAFFFLLEKSYNLSTVNPKEAVKGGNVEIIQYLHDQGIEFSPNSPEIAAQHGKVEALKWFINNGYSVNSTTCYGAIRSNNLDVVLFLMRLYPRLLFQEAWKLIVEKGTPENLEEFKDFYDVAWNSHALIKAINANNIANVKWLVNRGCVIEKVHLHIAKVCGKDDIYRFLLEKQGLPWVICTKTNLEKGFGIA